MAKSENKPVHCMPPHSHDTVRNCTRLAEGSSGVQVREDQSKTQYNVRKMCFKEWFRLPGQDYFSSWTRPSGLGSLRNSVGKIKRLKSRARPHRPHRSSCLTCNPQSASHDAAYKATETLLITWRRKKPLSTYRKCCD